MNPLGAPKRSPRHRLADELAGFCRGFLETIPRTIVNRERERRGLSPMVDAGSAARHHRREDDA